MDTPERKQIGNVISNFEDSPVFSYINSLSPIKPVKSTHISQTINSLSFSPVPSAFTSSYVISQKQPRLLRRHCFSELSKPESSSDSGNEGNRSVGILDSVDVSSCSADTQEIFDPGSSIQEVTIDPPNENSELAIELPRTMEYDCGSPVSDLTFHDIKIDPVAEVDVPSASLAQFVQDISVKSHHSFETEVELVGLCQLDQTKEEKGCDWENLISEASNLLLFDSFTDVEAPKGQNQNAVDSETRSFTSLPLNLPQDKIDDSPTTKPIDLIGSCEHHEVQELSNQPTKAAEQKESNHTHSSTFHGEQGDNDPKEEMDEKARNSTPFSCEHHSMRRRCLVFEKAGANKKSFEDGLSSSSSISCQSDGKFTSDDKQLVTFKSGCGSSRSMLPGIGLHLNALAATTKDCRVVKHEALASGRQLISVRSSIASYHCLLSEEKSLAKKSTEAEMCNADNEVLVMQDTSQSAFGVREEFNQSSLKKKRHANHLLTFLAENLFPDVRRVEHDGENEGCKRCNCKKSKCLKLYCECFAAGIYCVEPCSCRECFNKPVHEDTVLATRKQIESRNPLAFAPKVIRTSESVAEIGEESNETPASARHKKGCNCKKSSCLKKYCECYQGGVGCSISCRCKGCKNAFGRKDESTPIGVEEAEAEEEKTESCEKKIADERLPNNEAQKEEEQDSDHVLPMTPSFQIRRPSVQLLFSSSGKLQESPVLSIGSYAQPSKSQTLQSDFVPPLPKFKLHFQISPEDEAPEVLKGNCLPVTGMKTASPNSKRVRPPHNELGFRKSRKLVLQSIPSSTSLTPRNGNNDVPIKFK
ncbi:CRC domain [Macleaya cordata]|uniref:CRC domain n=1 Tax=Macleaya cordata TaxID=56857 RepID=A0A200Q4M6_MACCD|nr:CRC domain [Macleaya cordata]